MQAIAYDRYGPIDNLRTREIEPPNIGERDVLVRVSAAALHIGDTFAVEGAPFAMRLATGVLRPRYGVPGYDLAGKVQAVGSKVSRFKAGDHVFGASKGTCAEYVRVPEATLSAKPASLSFEEAAAIPTAALTALHGLRDAGRLQPGQHVLVNGASGGIGTFAVQIGKALGAEVTGVTSTRNADLVRSLGADRVIDYTRDDFADGSSHYDLIFDNVENRSLGDVRRALTDRGTLVLNSGTGAKGVRMLIRLVHPLALSPFVRHSLRRYLSKPNSADLDLLSEMVAQGKLKPVIDSTYSLQDVPAALKYIKTGHTRGKVVVVV